jgi:cyanophycinase
VKYFGLILALLFLTSCSEEQKTDNKTNQSKSKGKLFIIGGGDRTPELMTSLIQQAGLKAGDYIAVLPMAGEEPDSSFWYFKNDIPVQSKVICANLNFADSTRNFSSMRDSLRMAKLVFICGGDQSRFMNVVQKQNIHSLID